MTAANRDKWEAQAIGTVSGSFGTALGVTFGAPPWLAVVVYVIFSVAMVVWVNWRFDATIR